MTTTPVEPSRTPLSPLFPWPHVSLSLARLTSRMVRLHPTALQLKQQQRERMAAASAALLSVRQLTQKQRETIPVRTSLCPSSPRGTFSTPLCPTHRHRDTVPSERNSLSLAECLAGGKTFGGGAVFSSTAHAYEKELQRKQKKSFQEATENNKKKHQETSKGAEGTNNGTARTH